MKKRMALALATVLTLSLVMLGGCGAGEAADVAPAEPAVTQDETEEEPAAQEETVETENETSEDTEEADTASDEQEETADEASDEASGDDAGNASGIKLSDGITIPEVNAPALNLPDNEGVNFVNNLGVGFNLGNTFDAYCDPTPADEMETETYWHHTYTTQQMIKDIHAYGFDTIRIPVSWHNHVDGSYNITKQWMDRVQEVVDYAIDDDCSSCYNSNCWRTCKNGIADSCGSRNFVFV